MLRSVVRGLRYHFTLASQRSFIYMTKWSRFLIAWELFQPLLRFSLHGRPAYAGRFRARSNRIEYIATSPPLRLPRPDECTNRKSPLDDGGYAWRMPQANAKYPQRQRTFRERSVCGRGYTGGSQADRCSYVIVETEVNKASSKWLQKTDDASGEDEETRKEMILS